MTKIEAFFTRYEQGANTFDPALMSSLYTDQFMGGDPNGVACARNDGAWRDAFVQRKAFFQQLGFRCARVLKVEPTALDAHYTMAKVHWQMDFEKQPGHLQEFRFAITYFLFDAGDDPRVAFWISHEDEHKLMREAGLIGDGV